MFHVFDYFLLVIMFSSSSSSDNIIFFVGGGWVGGFVFVWLNVKRRGKKIEEENSVSDRDIDTRNNGDFHIIRE